MDGALFLCGFLPRKNDYFIAIKMDMSWMSNDNNKIKLLLAAANDRRLPPLGAASLRAGAKTPAAARLRAQNPQHENSEVFSSEMAKSQGKCAGNEQEMCGKRSKLDLD